MVSKCHRFNERGSESEVDMDGFRLSKEARAKETETPVTRSVQLCTNPQILEKNVPGKKKTANVRQLWLELI